MRAAVPTGSDPGPHVPPGGIAIEGIEDVLELLTSWDAYQSSLLARRMPRH